MPTPPALAISFLRLSDSQYMAACCVAHGEFLACLADICSLQNVRCRTRDRVSPLKQFPPGSQSDSGGGVHGAVCIPILRLACGSDECKPWTNGVRAR